MFIRSLVSEFWRNVEIFSFPDVLFTDFSCLQEKSVNKTPSENEAWKPFNVVHIRTVRDKDEDGEIGLSFYFVRYLATAGLGK